MKFLLHQLVLHSVFIFLFFFKESFCFPAVENEQSVIFSEKPSIHSFRGFLPLKSSKSRQIRAEGGDGIGGLLQSSIQDTISTTSAFTSPTMFVGGFSIIMQPMPNGTEFTGQMMNAIPGYMNLLSSVPSFLGSG